MLTKAFVTFMATTQGSGDEHLIASSTKVQTSSSRRSTRRGRNRRGSTDRPPRPNHFLSVRIDNSRIWQEVSSLQEDILEDNSHLRPAAIPVQDLHLTIFVANWNEEDGSLQRAAETLRNCGDILLELGLAPSESDNNPVCSQEDQEESHASSSDNPSHNTSPEITDATTFTKPNPETAEDGNTEALKETKSRSDDVSEIVSSACEGVGTVMPLELSFRGLGNFNNRVLYASLDEDDQADRFRRLACALHRRFWDAALLGTPVADNEGGGNIHDGTAAQEAQEPPEIDFTPHLTIMKTSKLKKRGVKIPPACYDSHHDMVFGSHTPVAVELSKMCEREEVPTVEGFEPRPYYKCVEKITLASTWTPRKTSAP